MKTLKILPSSTACKNMNDAQWLWCYSNIVQDEEEDEELWKMRLKYMGLFINPKAVYEMAKFEDKHNKTNHFNSRSNYSDDYRDEDIYVNDSFEEELQKAMNGNQFIEMPTEDDTRGDDNMSSDEFINQVKNNIDRFESIQRKIDDEIYAKRHGQQDVDLDLIEVDDD